MKKIWDISPPVHAQAAVFPGDTAYAQQLHFTLGPDCPVNVNAITMSPHTGAHADAPMHYAAGGAAVGTLDLTPFLGPCRVIHCLNAGPLIEPHHLAHALENVPPRVLIRTATCASQEWVSFTALDPASVAMLAIKNVVLIGIDTPSVDPSDSQQLPAHQELHRLKLRVLENLVLDDVPEGDYELIALPLKLTQADASPVRAILRTL
jgi:arylformamidase